MSDTKLYIYIQCKLVNSNCVNKKILFPGTRFYNVFIRNNYCNLKFSFLIKEESNFLFRRFLLIKQGVWDNLGRESNELVSIH